MALANLALTNTFDEWRIRTNQLVTEVNDINANTLATFISNNAGLRITTSPIRKGNIYFQLNVSTVTSDTASFNLASALSVNLVSNNATFANTVATNAYNQANAANVLAFNTGIGANAFATAAAAGANAYMIAVQNGANTDVGTGANTYLLATIAGANTVVGTGANTYLLATLSGANTAVGTGANTYLLTTLSGANTAVGTGANTFAATAAGTAFDKANAANVLAFTASQTATVAAGGYDKANSANILAFQVGGAVTTANLNNGVTFDKANAANFLAFTANVTANYANVLARTALELASLAVSNNTPALALSVAQSAFGFANTVNVATVASFGVANAALPNTTVTLNGSLLANAYVNTTSGFYSVSTGTALRPAYSWTTDNFTGMYRVGANTVGFSTAAASRLVIDANGFVGIGTTTPAKLLEISGGSSEVFVGTGSISGNVLTISSVVSGQINVGHYVTDEELNVLGGTYVKEYFGGTGGLGTYNLTASQATVTSTTIYAFNMHNNTFRITGTDTTVNPGQPIGMIEFASNDSDLTADERSRAFVYAVNEQANSGATLMFGTAIGSRESTERLRINRFGAVGIGGANFGTAGQTLQSNGSGSPPIWVNDFAFDKANAANVLAFNTGIGANAFASATVAGANTAVGTGANTYLLATIAGANTAVGTGANTYLLATIAGSNTAVGTGANAYSTAATAGANAFMIAVQNGANTAVGTGANTYLLATIAGANTAVGTGANTYLLATIAGANTAVGTGANAFATAAAAGANAFMITVQNGSNTAVGTGANTYLLATLSGANTAVGTGANTYLLTTLAGANTAVGTAANNFASATIAGANTAVGTGANTVGTAAFAKANTIGTLGTQSSSSVSITGGSISGLSSLAVAGTYGGTVANNAYRSIMITTSGSPTGGAAGDIWLQYTA
jgi:hypothetical protein